jgi:Ca-activated chloride channel family protein
MKLKAVRASLAAVLTATLLISLLPLAYADSATSQTQQGASSSKPRRGKNGEPVAKSPDNPDTSPEQGSAPDSKPETSKAASPAQPNEQQPAAPTDKTSQSAGQPVKTSAPRDTAQPVKTSAPRDTAQPVKTSPPQDSARPVKASPPQDSAQSQPQREPPPFDRPPLGANGRPAGDSSARSPDSSPPSSKPPGQRPSYSGTDSSTRGDSRSQPTTRSQTSTSTGVQRDRFPESSTGGDADPERTERSTGAPPELRRPADSRSRDDGVSQSPRPPVLRRPTDAQRDEGGSSDATVGRPSASGQPQGGAGQQQSGGEGDVIKLESTLINLPLLVSDRSGRYVPQLSARDFAIYEDGVEQKIASFGTEEVPFSVALLLDVSPSVQGNIQDIQDAAIAFVRQLRDQDRVMVVSFDRHIHYLSDFTSDRRELEWAIRKANTGSGTSVYDAVYEIVQHKLRNIDGRKALILFSDGEDTTSSRASYDDAVHLVTESDVLVYGLRYPGTGGRGGVRVDPWPRSPIPGVQLPFPFPWPFPRRRRGPFRLTNLTPTGNSAAPSASPQSWPRRNGGGRDFMADITAAGGGPVYDAEKIGDMSRVAYRIAEELRHVYVISYYPTNPLSNGGYRSVRVSVKGRDDIAVRHRRGYNAKPNGTAKPTI